MAGFFDSDKFIFVEIPGSGGGHLCPVHYRELGGKVNGLYSKKVSWADVTINNVPLEKTFEFEDSITEIENSKDLNSGNGTIIVNERSAPIDIPIADDDDHTIFQEKKCMNRLEKMTLNPITLPDAKKKNSKERYPVKPKSKKEVRDEKIFSSGEKFDEITDEKDLGIMEDVITRVRVRFDPVEEIKRLIKELEFNVDEHPVHCPKYRTYCPPEHWIRPVIQWDKIWSEMDQIEYGRKRSYHYVEPGSVNKDGVRGPAIYFYDEDSYDLNYNYNEYSDFIQGEPNLSIPFN